MQTLDDLFFVFLDTVEKLKPKVVVAENVTGLLKGNAKGYVNEIIKRFHSLGYDVQLFQLNAALMNVPQTRERVFFIANNQHYPKLKLNFNEKPILFGEVRSEKGDDSRNTEWKRILKKHFKYGDKCINDINQRLGKTGGFTDLIIYDKDVCYTVASNGQMFRACDKEHFTNSDIKNVSTFPQDYDFGKENVKYICGMSVPPNMTANIAMEIYKQWLFTGQEAVLVNGQGEGDV